jgi:hypothetical protein
MSDRLRATSPNTRDDTALLRTATEGSMTDNLDSDPAQRDGGDTDKAEPSSNITSHAPVTDETAKEEESAYGLKEAESDSAQFE